ncbi:hypothetical protein FM120_16130 [Sphingobacterium faecium PCAi_F2.5]|nr:hypothetical protein FM120_16130 [Sphingobacterium faecium PCAi_F2.5]
MVAPSESFELLCPNMVMGNRMVKISTATGIILLGVILFSVLIFLLNYSEQL